MKYFGDPVIKSLCQVWVELDEKRKKERKELFQKLLETEVIPQDWAKVFEAILRTNVVGYPYAQAFTRVVYNVLAPLYGDHLATKVCAILLKYQKAIFVKGYGYDDGKMYHLHPEAIGVFHDLAKFPEGHESPVVRAKKEQLDLFFFLARSKVREGVKA